MKFFRFKNFILGIFISITLFCGLNIDGFCATRSYTLQPNQSIDVILWTSAFPNNATWKKYTYPVTQITMGAGVTASPLTNFVSYCEEAHIVTSEGDFVVASYSSNGSTANTITVSGYPVSCYYVGKATAKNFTSGSATVAFNYESYYNLTYTVSDNSGLTTFLNDLDSEVDSIQRDTKNILNESYSIDSKVTQILNLVGGSGGAPSLSQLPNGYTPALFAFDHTLSNGNEYISNDPIFNIEYPDTTFYSDSRALDIINTVPFGTRSYLFTLSFDTPMDSADSWIVQLGFNSNGSSQDVITDPFQSVYNRSSGRVIFYKQLNDITDLSRLYFIVAQNVGVRSLTNIRYSAFVLDQSSSDWSVIADSTSLSDLNNTSSSVGNIISDNGDFEADAFTTFDSNLNEFGFDDWSLVPISSELTTTKNIITMFYNVLPFKIQWLFTTVMALGLIMMLLTVGTRVVQRTGEFTRAKPVKMSKSKGGK